MSAGSIHNRIRARQVHHIGGDSVESHRIQLGCRAMVEPARVVLPDRPHVPGHRPISLADVVFGGEHDLAHQGFHILAGVHPGDGLIVDVCDGVAQSGELAIDELGAGDRVKMTGHQNFGAQRAHPLDRGDGSQRVAVLVATHGDEVGDVAE